MTCSFLKLCIAWGPVSHANLFIMLTTSRDYHELCGSELAFTFEFLFSLLTADVQTGLYCVATLLNCSWIFPNSEYKFTFLFCVAYFVSYKWSNFACKTQSKSFIEHAFEPDVYVLANNLHLRTLGCGLSGTLNLKYRSVTANKWFHRH